MAAAETGFTVRGHFYPAATSFKMADPVLLEEITGLSYIDFIDRMPDEGDADEDPDFRMDPVVLLGMFAVAVWRSHPTWTRKKVRQFVQNLDSADVEFNAGDDGDDEEDEETPGGDAGPPDKPGAKASASKQSRSAPTRGSGRAK